METGGVFKRTIYLSFVAAVCLTAPAAAVELPKWSKASGTKGSRVIGDVSRYTIQVRAAASGVADGTNRDASLNLRIKLPKSKTGTVKKSWRLYGQEPLIGGGAKFLLATGTTTVRFKLLQKAYTWRIYDTDFDNYVNICINGSKTTWASGGRLYCEVRYPQRVKVSYTSKVKNLPRPRLLEASPLGIANATCTPGQTKTTVVSYLEQANVETCLDGQSDTGSDDEATSRNWQTSVRVASLYWAKRKVKTNGRTKTLRVQKVRYQTVTGSGAQEGGKGPGWVLTSRVPLCRTTLYDLVGPGELRTTEQNTYNGTERCVQSGSTASWVEIAQSPLPAPTATVSTSSLDWGGSTGRGWSFSGSGTTSYRGSCTYKLEAQNTLGIWHEADRPTSYNYSGTGSIYIYASSLDWLESSKGTPNGQFTVSLVSCT